MKYLFSLMVSGLLFFSANAAEKKEVLVVKTSIACDHCLQCSSCGQNINDKIRDTEKGIRKVKVDPKTNTITVTYLSDKTNPEQIRKAIAAAGFDADEVKATAAAYEKLDGCCKSNKISILTNKEITTNKKRGCSNCKNSLFSIEVFAD